MSAIGRSSGSQGRFSPQHSHSGFERQLAMFGNILGCHTKDGDASGIWWVSASDNAQHSAILQDSPQQQKIIQAKMSIVLRLRNPETEVGPSRGK